MPLDELIRNAPARWDKLNATNCWVNFSEKYLGYYGFALHHALINAELDNYIEHEALMFTGFATGWSFAMKIIDQEYYRERKKILTTEQLVWERYARQLVCHKGLN